LSFDAPSATGVAMAIAQGVLPKAQWLARNTLDLAWPMHGLPHTLHLDNGAEFHSRALKRGCQQHGVRINYRPPATPRFGGHIERLMGTLMTRVHALPGTTSSAIFTAIAEQRRVLAEAQADSKLARRAFARLAERRSTTESARRSPPTQTESDVNEVDKEARVPAVAEDDAWRTGFLA
jgi:transposase InsO family protein